MRRWWILTAAASSFALATGVALGVGLSLGSDSADAVGETVSESAIDQFDVDVAPLVAQNRIAGKLTGQNIALIISPGTAESVIADVTQSLTSAGGTITAQIRFTDLMLDSAERQFVQSVAEQSNPNAQLPTGLSSYQIAAQALVRSIIANDDADSTILRAFQVAELITIDANPKAPAQLVVFVTSTTRPDAGQAAIMAEFAGEFDQVSKGAIMTGPSVQSLTRGFIAEIGSPSISTFDALDSAVGRAMVAVVVAAEAAGTSGSWGTERADNGTLPAL